MSLLCPKMGLLSRDLAVGKINPLAREEIRSFCLLITGSVLFAFAVVALLIYVYNPSGLYRAGDLLVSPDFLGKRFSFELAEYSHFDTAKNSWVGYSVDEAAYRAFYKSVEEDESRDEIKDFFLKKVPAVLTIRVKEGLSQQVEFASESSYYRISVSQDGLWAYFEHNGIDHIARELFTKKGE